MNSSYCIIVRVSTVLHGWQLRPLTLNLRLQTDVRHHLVEITGQAFKRSFSLISGHSLLEMNKYCKASTVLRNRAWRGWYLSKEVLHCAALGSLYITKAKNSVRWGFWLSDS